ncbi:hypothetical protein O181_007720 [Austropuccinia psidii MF-1]|uniref:Mpv17-like protein n=1 Tax=Austropuccinia psidii MF-1 TaxID=1389203 RepID=A0A9Q3BMZ1_9BASI|nr:hypothetical protein [Austropuccinia psidii MF-1]
MQTVGRHYLRLLRTHTLLTQMGTAGLVFPLGDTISQHFVEDKSWQNHDYSRTLRYTIFGALGWAPIAYKWHGLLNKITYSTTLKTISARVAIDMLIFAPFATCYFFTSMGLLEKRNWAEIKHRVTKNFYRVVSTNISVFGPAQVINMAFLPVYARPPFLNLVSLGYNCFLASVNVHEASTSLNAEGSIHPIQKS